MVGWMVVGSSVAWAREVEWEQRVAWERLVASVEPARCLRHWVVVSQNSSSLPDSMSDFHPNHIGEQITRANCPYLPTAG